MNQSQKPETTTSTPKTSEPEQPEPKPSLLMAEVVVPPVDKWSSQKAISFTKSFLEGFKAGDPVLATLTLSGSSEGIHWSVSLGDPTFENEFTISDLSQLVKPLYPGVQVTDQPEQDLLFPFFRQFVVFGRNQESFFHPALSAEKITSHDPLSILAQAMTSLLPHERMVYTVWVAGKTVLTEKQINDIVMVTTRQDEELSRRKYGSPYPRRSLSENIWWSVFEYIFGATKVPRSDWTKAEHELYGAKLSQPMYNCFITLRVDSPHEERMGVLSAPLAAIEGLSLPVGVR